MTYEDIELRIQGAVAIASLNRPERLNAFRRQTFREFGGILEEVAAANSIRVLIITGKGRAFSAGKDLKEIDPEHAGPNAGDRSRAEVEQIQDMTRRMLSHPKVLIAAVNGPAIGFGAELSLNCDFRLAADNASFAFIEPKRALFPTNAAHFLLPRLVGQGRAAEMLLSGNTVAAADASQWGLVNRIFPDDRLMDAAVEIANTIAANAPLSVRQCVDLLRQNSKLTLEEVLLEEVDAAMRCLQSNDVLEGARAFFERRQPTFKGE
ncbi:MAG: enoyl-CoA hydratase/isomerase family protein [Candidatus Acidiferrales bacterium]